MMTGFDKIVIKATDKESGEVVLIDDLYWFEENYVHGFDDPRWEFKFLQDEKEARRAEIELQLTEIGQLTRQKERVQKELASLMERLNELPEVKDLWKALETLEEQFPPPPMEEDG